PRFRHAKRRQRHSSHKPRHRLQRCGPSAAGALVRRREAQQRRRARAARVNFIPAASVRAERAQHAQRVTRRQPALRASQGTPREAGGCAPARPRQTARTFARAALRERALRERPPRTCPTRTAAAASARRGDAHVKRRTAVRTTVLAALCATGIAISAPSQTTPSEPPARTAERIALGRALFFESRLSGDGSRSCASCHAPHKGFADGEPLSRGYNRSGHFRNTPSLLAISMKSRLMWDGRHPADRLADVVVEMLTSAVTMNGDPQIIVERVRQLPGLLDAWRRAYGERRTPDFDGVVEALATYTAAHGNEETAADRALAGDSGALSEQTREGLRLFTGKA